MTDSPKLQFPFLAEGGAGLEYVTNDALLLLDQASGLGFTIIDRDLTAPPTSGLAQGDTYIPAATATGSWSGQEGNLAVYDGSGWVFVEPRTGISGWIEDEKFLIAYDEGESEWFAVQDVWPSTEIWSGKYRDGSKVYYKTVDLGELPNATSKSVAHGITGIDLTYKKSPHVKGVASNGSTAAFNIPTLRLAADIYEVRVNSTNVVVQTAHDATNFDGFVRLEYCKT